MMDSNSIDALRVFSEACRAELQTFKLIWAGVRWGLKLGSQLSKHSFSGSPAFPLGQEKGHTGDYAATTH